MEAAFFQLFLLRVHTKRMDLVSYTFAFLSSECGHKVIMSISIYTLSDLGDLSNLIGSLSRTIQQYSPPSEWIMCELGVFPIFLENNLLKVAKILRFK